MQMHLHVCKRAGGTSCEVRVSILDAPGSGSPTYWCMRVTGDMLHISTNSFTLTC